MSTDLLAKTIRSINEQLSLVNEDNHGFQLEGISEIIRTYRDKGGNGRPVYEHLLQLSENHADHSLKDELLFELINRMCGFGPPKKAIAFPDYDPVSGEWY